MFEKDKWQSGAHLYNYAKKIVQNNDVFVDLSIAEGHIYYMFTCHLRKDDFSEMNWYTPAEYFISKIKNCSTAEGVIQAVRDVDGTCEAIDVFLEEGYSEWLIKTYPDLNIYKRQDFSLANKLRWGFGLNISEDNSDEFLEIVSQLQGVHGVYYLYDDQKNLVYIGRSKSLGSRIIGSINERKAKYFSYTVCESLADAFILEPYLISIFKPKLNSEFRTDQPPTIQIHIPERSEIIKIYK